MFSQFECRELYPELNQADKGDQIVEPSMVNCARYLRNWQVNNRIPFNTEVGCGIGTSDGKILQVGPFATGSNDHIILTPAGGSIGSIHAHASRNPQSMGDITALLTRSPEQVSAVLNREDQFFVIMKNFPHRLNRHQVEDVFGESIRMNLAYFWMEYANFFGKNPNPDSHFALIADKALKVGFKGKFFTGHLGTNTLTCIA